MILQALYELAQAEDLIGDPDFEYRPVSWIVELREDGSLIQIADHRFNRNEGKTSRTGKALKPSLAGRPLRVPVQATRTSGDRAYFLVDKSDYVLGVVPGGKTSSKRRDYFTDLVRACAEDTRDKHILAAIKFLEQPFDASNLPADLQSNDLIALKVGNELLHNRSSVVTWWKRQRDRGRVDGKTGQMCLVTGVEVGRAARSPGFNRLPDALKDLLSALDLYPLIKRVPGGTSSGNALVSFNASAFESLALSGNDNAPISRQVAEGWGRALNRLLDHREPLNGHGERLPTRRIDLSSDTTVVYWSPDGNGELLDALPGLLDAGPDTDPDQVSELYRSVWTGKPPRLDSRARFYAMTLTGTQGRVIVRDWFETTVKQVADNLAHHFAAIEVVRNTAPPKNDPHANERPIPLRRLLDALASPGRDTSVSATLAAELWRAALNGSGYPVSLLQRALLRERAEAAGDEWIDSARRDARAALIKAVLVQHYTIDVRPDMDPTIDNIGYRFGAMFAVLERLQAAALGDVNASIVDKYFSSASATPRAVFVRLLKAARHHARKARESDDRRDRGMAFRCEQLIDELASGLGIGHKVYPPKVNAFPASLSLPDQGMFVLGYHQMRHWLWMNRDERAAWENKHPDCPRAFQWSRNENPEETIHVGS